MMMPSDNIDIKAALPERNASNVDMSLNFSGIVNDVKKLREILLKENELLKKMKVKEIGEIHEEKVRLIRRLEISKQLVRKNPSLMNERRDEEINEFIEISADLDQIVGENYREVLKAKEVNKRVVEAIFHAVVDNQGNTLGYNKQGFSGAAAQMNNRYTPAITIDKAV